MSNRSGNSGSPSRKDTVEFEDVAPEESASQVASSLSRANQAARRAAAEVRAQTAQITVQRELQIAAIRQEVLDIERAGEQEALVAGDEAFKEELRNDGTYEQGSVHESGGIGTWAMNSQLPRIQTREMRTSCMVMYGPSKSDVNPDSSEQLLVPRKLFREEESRSCVTHVGKSARSKPPYVMENADEGRTARIKEWVSNVATHGVGGETDEAFAEQDAEIKLKKSGWAYDPVTGVPRGGGQSEAPGMAESSPACWQRGWHSVISMDPQLTRRSSEAPEVAESSPASRRRGGHNANPRMVRNTSEAPEVAEASPASRRRGGHPANPRMVRSASEAPGVAEASPASWHGSRHSVMNEEPRLARRTSGAYGMTEWSPVSWREDGRSGESRLEQGLELVSPRRRGTSAISRHWEEPSVSRRSRRTLSPASQRGSSVTGYADLPLVTQRIDQESLPSWERRRVESSLPSPYESAIVDEDRYLMEVPREAPVAAERKGTSRRLSVDASSVYEEVPPRRAAKASPRNPYGESPRRGRTEGTPRSARTMGNTDRAGKGAISGLETLIGVLQAPKVDLPVFRGDPMRYHTFMRAFDDNVEKAIEDPSSKLARLVQLCAGEAARVIQGCTLMHPERGYARARQLLKERFGDEFVIAELWGQRLLEIGTRMPLREFADELRACFESLDALNALGELQTQGNLAEIIKKLPAFLQNRWRDVVRRIKVHEQRRPDLQDVVEFVEEAAAVASDPVYGNQSQKTEKSHVSRATYATSICDACPYCEEEGHEVLGCERFVALQPEERLQAAIKIKLCFVCLRGRYITRNCASRTKCKVEDCGRMHAAILHAANWTKLREQGRKRREQGAGGRWS